MFWNEIQIMGLHLFLLFGDICGPLVNDCFSGVGRYEAKSLGNAQQLCELSAE